MRDSRDSSPAWPAQRCAPRSKPKPSKPASARPARPIRPPPELTLAEAHSVGLVSSKTARVPNASILQSSEVRRRRLCRRGPSVPHRRDREEAAEHLQHEVGPLREREREEGTALGAGPREAFQASAKPTTPPPRLKHKKLDVESVAFSESLEA